MKVVEPDNRYLIAGLLMLPAILFQDAWAYLILQTGIVIIAAIRAGRRFRLLPNIIILVSVVVANSIQVNGRVLISIGTFDLTLGALELGLVKALKLIAMVYLSQFMVAGKPLLPGRFGALVSMQFVYFEHIMELWERKERKASKPKVPRGERRTAHITLIHRLDDLLIQLEQMELQDVMDKDAITPPKGEPPPSAVDDRPSVRRRTSLIELILISMSVWGALLLSVLL